LDDKLKMIVLPGGMPGTLNLEKSAAVQKAVDYCAENGVFIGAICAAPSILGHKGLLNGREAVCYKGWEEHLQGALIQDAETVRDDNIITARGAGVSFEFGLALVEALLGGEQADELREVTMCAKRRS
jgi:4-methyl-5(b-hydroxyethyl)-thiazole monophosphate biosynthesis